jgi:hypothetical protein
MIVEALRRTHELILKTSDEEFSRFEECDLHRLLVYRFLAEAMDRMGLPETRKREVVAAFRDLGASLADPRALEAIKGTLQPELKRVNPRDPLKNRTLRAMALAIALAQWRWPRRLDGFPTSTRLPESLREGMRHPGPGCSVAGSSAFPPLEHQLGQ